MTPDQIKRYFLDMAYGRAPTLDQFQNKKNASSKTGKKMSIYGYDHNTKPETKTSLFGL